MKHISIAFISIVVLLSPWIVKSFPSTVEYVSQNYIENIDEFLAAVIHKPVQIADVKSKYNTVTKKVRILIVPGHEPSFGGAEYGNLKERDMTVDLANNLSEFFLNNSHYQVFVTRDKERWNVDLDNYFKNNWNDIVAFLSESKTDLLKSISDGSVQRPKDSSVYHNNAPKNVAYRLYGINKWSNENEIDIAIHIHFNDYPRNDASKPGKYSGLAIYVPERSFYNSSTTDAIAKTVYNRLSKYNATSNLPNEDVGIVEDDDLIAIGAYNTADAASMLIEYGYIYEPQFADPTIRSKTVRELAYQTYLGIEDFFDQKGNAGIAYDTLVLPYKWENIMDEKSDSKSEIFALQTALAHEGVYPPQGMDKNSCPRTGKIGPCTKASINEFQKKYGIKGENNVVGKKTLEILNNKYSVKGVI
jgi:N-acetylmuramoyl-L-alanine amidase